MRISNATLAQALNRKGRPLNTKATEVYTTDEFGDFKTKYNIMMEQKHIDYDAFSDVLRVIMRRQGETLESLAYRVNLSERTLRRYRNKETRGINLNLAMYIINHTTLEEFKRIFGQ